MMCSDNSSAGPLLKRRSKRTYSQAAENQTSKAWPAWSCAGRTSTVVSPAIVMPKPSGRWYAASVNRARSLRPSALTKPSAHKNCAHSHRLNF